MLCAWMARRPGATGTQRGQTTRVGLRSPDKGEEGEEAILGGSCRQRWQGGAGPGTCWPAGAWEDLGAGSLEQLWPLNSVCRPLGLGQLGSRNDCGQG